jgi:predicted NBD/HSP70 family sugar kinase
MCNVFGSDFVVIGGGFGVAGFEWIIPEALEVAKRDALDAAGATLRVVRAELGTMAGLIGAGLIALEAVS